MTSKVFVALRVPASPSRAFDAFTQEIALWWEPSSLFAITPRGDGKLAFEPGVGGRLFTTLADGREFKGVVELKARLLERKEEFGRGFVEQMLTYALGRKLEFYDAATVKQIAAP